MTAADRMTAGYADQKPEEAQRAQRRRVAAGFRYDPKLERLLGLADRDPARYDRLSPTVRMQIGFYASAKAAAEAAGIDTRPPKEAK